MTRDEIATRLGWTRNDMVDVVEKIVQAAVEAEREACAKIAEAYEPRCDTCPSGVSTAIRARGA
jgi:hypothetical protein